MLKDYCCSSCTFCVGINATLAALSLPIGIYFSIVECPTGEKYSRMCMIGVLLIWIGALNLILLVFSIVFIKLASARRSLFGKKDSMDVQISGIMEKRAS
nr:hypothetical transcript [Hymenolepis microstoma]